MVSSFRLVLVKSPQNNVCAAKADGTKVEFKVRSRIDSKIEVEYYKNGGILQYVLRSFLKD